MGVGGDGGEGQIVVQLEIGPQAGLPETVVAGRTTAENAIAPIGGARRARAARIIFEIGGVRAAAGTLDRSGAIVRHDLRGLRVALVAPAIDVEQEFDLVAGLPVEQHAALEHVLLAQFVRPGEAFLPGTGLDGAYRDAGFERIAHRTGHIALHVIGGKTAETGGRPRLEIIGRLGDDIVDRAAGGILAEKRALRPFENFDTLDIEGRATRRRAERQRDFVGIDGHGRRGGQGRFVEADAAQRIDRRVERRRLNGQARHDLAEVGRRIDAALKQRVAGFRRDGNADVRQRLFALVGGHDDVSVSVVAAPARLRIGGLRAGGAGPGDQCDQRCADAICHAACADHAHCPSPRFRARFLQVAFMILRKGPPWTCHGGPFYRFTS